MLKGLRHAFCVSSPLFALFGALADRVNQRAFFLFRFPDYRPPWGNWLALAAAGANIGICSSEPPSSDIT
jgi:hypothetical protein